MAESPPILRLSELSPGQFADCYVLLAEKSRSTTRDGKPYFSCRFRDSKRTASCMIWADGSWYEACETTWAAGQFYKIRILYGEHERYGPQVELHQIRPVNDDDPQHGFDPQDFVPGPRKDVDAFFVELIGLVKEHIDDEALRKLVLGLLEVNSDRFKRAPASRRHYYPYPGGLIEHTLSLTRNCLYLLERYEEQHPDMGLERGLLVAGAVAHDLGRLFEFNDDPFLPEPTVPGKLLGHIQLARDLVRDAARDIDGLEPETLLKLDHLILSHLSLPEWGSPRLPMIAECLILHHADDLDAKMEMYARCLRDDRSDGPFTDRDPALNKALLKRKKS